MLRQYLPRRFTSASSLVLHVLVLVLLPIADARLEVTALFDTMHVEAEGEGACIPSHNDLTCQICRTISAPTVLSEGGNEWPISTSATHASGLDLDLLPTRLSCPSQLAARAPPLVV